MFKNRVYTTVSAVAGAGLGDFTIGTAVSGYKKFTSADNGYSFNITITQGLDWEVRTGCVYTSATDTLSRGTLENSSTDAPIAFTAGCYLFNSPSASTFGVYNGSSTALTSAASVTTDASVGNIFTLLLDHNATLANPTNMRNGETYTWRITQGAGGPYTLAFGNKFKFPGGIAPAVTATVGAIDNMVGQYYQDTDALLVPGLNLQFEAGVYPLMFTFNTTLAGTLSIGVYFQSSTSVTVNWGDGATTTYPPPVTMYPYDHTYSTNGIYTISISGDIDTFGGLHSSSVAGLTTIIHWGSSNALEYLSDACYGTTNLASVPNNIPVSVIWLDSMFQNSTSIPNNIAAWNMSNVENFESMFYNCASFNVDISTWNTSSATNMYAMFYGNSAFNRDIGAWNTGLVTNMGYMFANCTIFNQDLSGWCVSLIPSWPTNFLLNTPAWTLPKPVWGTCPP